MNTPHGSALAKRKGFDAFLRGPSQDLPWRRLALLTLLILTAIAYIWGLNQSGWSNSFYSAAVQAGTKSWKAFFFGSLDASNYITVDKPPASLWVMELTARIFGLNPWSILVPEALEGVACVWILHNTVRRWFGSGAGLLAGAVLAVTPVAALMFRFNNPDALLVLLLTASVYALTRALEAGKTKWLVWASIFIGIGFLTKMLAAFLVIPAFVTVYLVFSPVSFRKRLVQVIISAVTVVLSAGWWIAIVQLIPASDRPYIGSSQDNSILNLIFGYNGLGRLSGSGSGMGGGSMFSGATGPLRLFQTDMGGQISWLIPAALILFIVTIWLVRRNWRTDRAFQAIWLWFLSFFVTGVVFSFGQGVIHTYYTIALAPSIAAMVGIGAKALWDRKDQNIARFGLATATLAASVWAFVLLDRTPTWYPWLRFTVLVLGILAPIGIMTVTWHNRKLKISVAAVALFVGLTGPLAYTLDTVATSHTGSTPTAGPAVANMGFGNHLGGGFGGFNSRSNPAGSAENSRDFIIRAARTSNHNGFGGIGGSNDTPSAALVELLQKNASKYTWVLATSNAMSSASYQLATGDPVMAMGGFTGSDPAITLSEFKKLVSERKIHYYIADGMGGAGRFVDNGAASGEIPGSTNSGPSTSASNNGFPGGVSSGEIPGSTNSGPSTSTNNNGFPGGVPNGNANRGSGSAISTINSWVENNFKTVTVGGVTVYDLTQTKS